MSYTANRYPHVRAAVAWTPEIAALAREHNDANVLVLPARFVGTEEGKAISEGVARHAVRRRPPRAPRREDRARRRDGYFNRGETLMSSWSNWERCPPGEALREGDPEIAALIEEEIARQNDGIELIASENFVSPAVLEAMGSPLTNKYAEGLPGQAVLRRLRGGGQGRAARDRSREAAVRRRSRQRAAALRRAGECGGVPRLPQAGRHLPRDGPVAGRAPHARLAGELLRAAVQGGLVRS